MHVHNDNFFIQGQEHVTIKILSPADIANFLSLVQFSRIPNNPFNISSSDLYAGTVSSLGVFQIRFNGDPNTLSNIPSLNTDKIEENYIDYFKEYGFDNVDQALLNFLKNDVDIPQIELLQITLNNDGSSIVEKLELNNDGSVSKTPCP